ncbi:hypothetical protein E4U21_001237 [Claviceps maximensis]|nr:hypothetical protein E4U21_001237 [Claviceps maximensis]
MASDATKVPGPGRRLREEYRQTVPLEEELDLPPTYQEASSSHIIESVRGPRSETSDVTPPSFSPSSSSSPKASAVLLSSENKAATASCSDGSVEMKAGVPLPGHDANLTPRRRAEQEQRQQVDDAWHHGRHPSDSSSFLHKPAHNHTGSIDGTRASVDTAGYKASDPMYWHDRARKGTWDAYQDAGCCGSTTGGCCFSSRGGCCFSDRGGCLCSDRDGCCFSDRGGCFFSDLAGGCFSTGDACCCSKRASHGGQDRLRL